jgi:hypothetical protein
MKKGNVDRAGKMLLGVLFAWQDFDDLRTIVFHLLHLFNADSSTHGYSIIALRPERSHPSRYWFTSLLLNDYDFCPIG